MPGPADLGLSAQEPAEGTEGNDNPSAQGEEVILSPEEFAEQFGNVKVRYKVNGEEVVRDANEILKRDQLYSGREGVIGERDRQTARLLGELQEQVEELKKGGAKPSGEAKQEEPDEATQFVDSRIERALKPLVSKLEERLNALTGDVSVVAGDGHFRAAKQAVSDLGVPVEDFETRRADMLAVFEKRLGRSLTTQEVNSIKAPLWTQAYLVVKAGESKEMKKAPGTSKTIVQVKPEESRAGSPSPTVRTNVSRSLQDAIEGKKSWTEHLSTKIKPLPPRGG